MHPLVHKITVIPTGNVRRWTEPRYLAYAMLGALALGAGDAMANRFGYPSASLFAANGTVATLACVVRLVRRMQRIGALLCSFALAWFLLISSADAQSARGSVASPVQRAATNTEQEAQVLRLQIQQMRRNFEQQLDVLERRLDALESANGSNPPNTPDTAQKLQRAATGLASNGPSLSAQQQSASGSQTAAQQQARENEAEAVGESPLYQNTNRQSPPASQNPLDTGVKQAPLEKAERITGKNDGKTPTYQNLNDQQNPTIQQAKAFEFHGYLRAGEGINSQGGQQVAFEAPGAPAKYRLGNETDTYGEFVFVNNWVNTHAPQDHAWFHTEILISADTTESTQGDSTDNFNLKEAFVRGGNLFASHPDWKFWAGERYYRRWNIDEIDWYMQDMSGYGGGIEDVHLGGPVRIAFAYLGGVIHADQLKSGPFLKNTFDLDWYGLRGFRGTFGGRVYYSSAKGGQVENSSTTVPGAHGYAIEVGHNIKNLLGGNDRTVVQYAIGEAANFYTTALTPEPWIKNATGLRVTNQFLIEPGDPYERFSIFATTAYQRYKSLNAANAVDSWISFGGRPQWYFTNHFNIALEAGADHVIEGSGNYSGWLRKVTIAPEVSSGRGYYSRPAVRLFVTYANWTDGFKDHVGGPAFLDLKQGLTAGLQFENWW